MENKLEKLPTLNELHYDVELAFKNDKFNLLLNQSPIDKWIKQNPYAGNTNYIPIEKIEFLLTRIFQDWKIEVISFSQLFNSVACHIRLHYLSPVTGEWKYHDGVGAVGIQTDAGKTAADLSAIKQNAVMMALPAAKSYALKDAAELLGVLFGKNLNRKDTIGFYGAYGKQEKFTQEVQIEIERIGDIETLDIFYAANSELHKNLEFRSAINTQRAKLKK